jgi:ABC-type lipoprotein export system ATPase subunit
VSAIDATDLVFERPSGFTLRIPRWSVASGDRVVLHGPSGCGKSTLLSLVAGELGPTGGALHVLGVNLGAASDAARRSHRVRSLGLIFQDFPLVEYLDVLDNVLLPFRINPSQSLTAAARERAQALLEDLGIGALARRRPAALSQGERQRVAIARALVTDPSLILADEPTTGLDPVATDHLMALLERLVSDRGTTLVLVSHDRAVIERFDDRVPVADWKVGS